MEACRWGAQCLYFYSLMYDFMYEDKLHPSRTQLPQVQPYQPSRYVHVKSALLAPWKPSLRHKSQRVRIESPRMVRRSGFTFRVVPRFSIVIGKPDGARRVGKTGMHMSCSSLLG